jgi:ammonium transporter, Amt family
MSPLRKLYFCIWSLFGLLASAVVALGQDASVDERLAKIEGMAVSAQSAGDNAWMLVSSALVLMMTAPGLALFYGGLVRKKNVLSTMMQSFIMMGVVTVIWAIYGYSFAFANGSTPFIGGLTHLFMEGVGGAPNATYAPTIPHQTWMVFQLMFAIITPALITGAFAERMKFSAMLAFMILWVTVVYFPLAHMVWGNGGYLNAWLGGQIQALDFAGGTVVHISSGFSALICALYMGKRLGFPKAPMPPHSLVISVIGAALLWVGWFGFNAGSALGASAVASNAFVTTHFAAAAATLGWVVAEWLRHGKPTVLGAISGAVAGLVGITPAAGFVTPMSALIIGLIAGVGCMIMVTEVKKLLGYDDSLDAFGVHGVGGTLGAILTGVFATMEVGVSPYKAADGTTLLPVGLVDGNASQVVNQLLAVVIAILIAVIATAIILKLVDLVIGLRVSDEEELEGLDLTQHGEEGYNMEIDTITGSAAGRAIPSPLTARAAVVED